MPENRLIQGFSGISTHKLIPMRKYSTAGFLLFWGFCAANAKAIVKLSTLDNTPYAKIGDEVRSLADAVPFDIPDSREWVQLIDVCEYIQRGDCCLESISKES